MRILVQRIVKKEISKNNLLGVGGSLKNNQAGLELGSGMNAHEEYAETNRKE